MRVAVVDIGTNSTRLLVADVVDGSVTELERRSTVTRLGQGVDKTGALAEEAIGRVTTTLTEYREAIDAHDAKRTVAVLTSAVRDAANGPEFTSRVRDEFGLDARTIPGEEEARLTFMGATSERDTTGGSVVVIDIGGGSTELVVGEGREVLFFTSTQAGVVRQSERHLHTDPPTPAEVDALRAEVREIITKAVPADMRERPQGAIAVAGTATQLAAVDLRLEPYDPARVHGHRLTLATIDALADRLSALPEARRKQDVPGLDPARAPTIVAGAAMLGEVLRTFGLTEAEVSEHDILRGAALDAATR